MSRSENLPVLPQTASVVLRLADDHDSSPKEIERAVERDPALTAKLLRVANSAYYGSPKVPTVGRAISFLGLSAVRSLVVSVSFAQMLGTKGATPSFDKLEYWRHTLATAIACRIVGKLKIPLKAEEIYCAGMLHDIGMLAMDKFCPQDFYGAIQTARSTGRPLHEVEKEQMGFSHADVGAVLAKRWGLSQMVCNAAQYHHNAIEDGEYFDTTSIVSFCNYLAHCTGFGNNAPTDQYPDINVLSAIDLPEHQVEVIKQVTALEVAKGEEAFNIA